MSGVNKVILVGHLGSDPEVRYTNNGRAMARFNIATSESWSDKEGQKQKKAEFHNIVAWGKLGEICAQYLQKGKLVFIEGRVETRSWDAPDGTKKYKTEVIAEGMQMGPKLSGNSSDNRLSDEKQSSSGEEIPVIESDGEIEMKDIPF